MYARRGQVGEQLGLFMYANLFSSVIFGITALGYLHIWRSLGIYSWIFHSKILLTSRQMTLLDIMIIQTDMTSSL